MARARSQGNGKLDRLDEAMTSLVQAQALLIQTQAAAQAQIADAQRRMAEYERETAQRFARIETILLDHTRILGEHTRILAEHGRLIQALTEAVREKIGSKASLARRRITAALHPRRRGAPPACPPASARPWPPAGPAAGR